MATRRVTGDYVAAVLVALTLIVFADSASPVPPVGDGSEYENIKVYKDKTIKDLVEGSVDGSVSWKTESTVTALTRFRGSTL